MRGRRLSSRSARDSARCRFISGKAARQNCGKPQAHDTKEPLHASQACAQCYAQYDNRRAIIITALDAEAILRAGALLLRCSPPTRLSKVPAMPVFANLDRIPLLQVAVQDDRIDLTLHAMHAKTSCLTWHDRRRAASRHRTAAPRQAGSWRRPATQTFPGLRAEVRLLQEVAGLSQHLTSDLTNTPHCSGALPVPVPVTYR